MDFWITIMVMGLSFSVLLFLLSSGLSLIFGLMNVLNLTHGGYYLIGSFVGISIYKWTGNFLLAILAGGGGGVGNPLDRDVERVRWDVLNEYISLENAREVYGVVLKKGTDEVDVKATKQLRKKLKAARMPLTKSKRKKSA